MTEDHPFYPHPPMPLAETYRLAVGIQRPDPRGCDSCREAEAIRSLSGPFPFNFHPSVFSRSLDYIDPQGVWHTHVFTEDGR